MPFDSRKFTALANYDPSQPFPFTLQDSLQFALQGNLQVVQAILSHYQVEDHSKIRGLCVEQKLFSGKTYGLSSWSLL